MEMMARFGIYKSAITQTVHRALWITHMYNTPLKNKEEK
jgi:hypothetical protein